MTDLHQHQQRSPVSRTPSGLVQLPPIHRDVLIRRGKRTLDPATLDPEATVQQVYTNDHFTEIVSIPLGDVVQLPASGLGVARLVLCKAFHSAERGCSNRQCRRVHARLPTSSQSDMRTEQAEDPASPRPPAVQKVHVNYAWRSLAAVAYPRFGSGMILAVAPPNVDGPLEYLDSASVLKTNALDSTRPRPLRHCAHYRFNRACNLGPECHFIHAVFIDPNAKKHQRAPTPMELHHHQSSCQWESASSSCESTSNVPCVDSEWMPFREYESSPSEAFATSSDVVTPFVGRYRFDAYSWTQVRRPVLPHRAAAHSCSSSSIGGCSVDANPSPLSSSEGDEEEEHQVTLHESISTRRGVSSPNTSTINL